MIATTIISSIRVKPFIARFISISLVLRHRYKVPVPFRSKRCSTRNSAMVRSFRMVGGQMHDANEY